MKINLVWETKDKHVNSTVIEGGIYDVSDVGKIANRKLQELGGSENIKWLRANMHGVELWVTPDRLVYTG